MFSGLFNLIPTQEEVAQDEQAGASSEDHAASAETGSTGAALGVNLWGLASAVTTTFKARTDELVKSVQQTDWRAEIMAFSKEAAEEGKSLSHKAAEVVEHLPEVVAPLPEQAGKAVRELPLNPPEVSEAMMQVGDTLKGFGQSLLVGTKELIEQLRDGVETEIAVATKESKRAGRASKSAAAAAKLAAAGPAGKYKRFEAEVAAMQRDSATYCDEPADTEDFASWKAGFDFATAQADIDRLLAENAFMSELQARIVPIIVEREDFWHRYFYRLHKLQAKEEARTQMAQRAKARIEEEDVAWDDDDNTAGDESKAAGDADSRGAVEGVATKLADQPAQSNTAFDLGEVPLADGPGAEGDAKQAGAVEGAGGTEEPAESAQQGHAEVSAEDDNAAAAEPCPAVTEATEPSSSPAHRDSHAATVSTHSSAGGAGNEHGSASGSSKGEWCVVPDGDAAPAQPAPATSPSSSSQPDNEESPKQKPTAPPAQPAQPAPTKTVPAAAAPVAKPAEPPVAVTPVAAAPVAAVAAVAAAAAPGQPDANVVDEAPKAEEESGSELAQEDEAWGDWD